MVVSITSIRLRSLFGFFKLSFNGLKITLQARNLPGFITMKNTGFGYLHYTVSMWKSLEEVKAFSRSGAHLEALKIANSLAKEIRIYTYESESLPSWNEAKALVEKSGKVLSYR